MVEYSLFEKIKAVFNLTVASPLFLILLLGMLLMLIDMLYISKKDKKSKIIYGVVSSVIVVIFMYSYIDSVLKIFDTIAKNIVAIIYFPTVLEYVVMLLISLILLTYSLLSKKIKPLIKRINTFVFVVNMFLFFLIIDQIAGYDVDLTNKVSIYTNSNLMILLELSLFIFIIWIISLVLYKVVKLLTPKEPEEETKEVNMNFYDEPVLPKKAEDLRNKDLIPDAKIEYVVIEKKREDDMFTLDEYKKMRALLELIKEEEKKS